MLEGNLRKIIDDGGGTDKVRTVPSSKRWRVLSAFADITTNSTSGDRQFALELRDPDDVVFWCHLFGAAIAPSQTNVLRHAGLGVDLPLDLELSAGWDFRVRDLNAVSSGDTMKIRVLIDEARG